MMGLYHWPEISLAQPLIALIAAIIVTIAVMVEEPAR